MILHIILLVLLWILIVIALLVLVFTMVPLRVSVEYRGGKPKVTLHILAFRVILYGREEKRATKKAEKKAKEETERLVPMRKTLMKALEYYRGKSRIPLNKLHLDVAIGGEDPASAAILFGASQVGLGIIWPVLEQNFKIKQHRIRTRLDFTQEKTVLEYAYVSLPIPLFKALLTVARTLSWLVREREREKEKAARQETGKPAAETKKQNA